MSLIRNLQGDDSVCVCVCIYIYAENINMYPSCYVTKSSHFLIGHTELLGSCSLPSYCFLPEYCAVEPRLKALNKKVLNFGCVSIQI